VANEVIPKVTARRGGALLREILFWIATCIIAVGIPNLVIRYAVFEAVRYSGLTVVEVSLVPDLYTIVGFYLIAIIMHLSVGLRLLMRSHWRYKVLRISLPFVEFFCIALFLDKLGRPLMSWGIIAGLLSGAIILIIEALTSSERRRMGNSGVD
jgi:hypothetical protein